MVPSRAHSRQHARMLRWRWLGPLLLLSVASPRLASATYSPPLTEVRIHRDRLVHTPGVVYASDRRTTPATDLRLGGFGVQYIAQLEWASGFGVQAGASIGLAQVGGEVGRLALGGVQVDTRGYWLGGQLRAYQMLWESEALEGERPSAVTAFINVRSLYYDVSGDLPDGQAHLRFLTVTGGLGAMAELSLTDHLSLCPYAWLTPGIRSRLDYTVRDRDFDSDIGLTLRSPFLFGIDLWIYLDPTNWEQHLSLSVLASVVDTQGEDRTIATVIGYTF